MATDAFERVRSAEAKAEEIVASAKRDAVRILEDAARQAEQILAQGEQEAERDASAKLAAAEAANQSKANYAWAEVEKDVEKLKEEALLKKADAVAKIAAAFA
jgi:vacuolar-type H+-ATPase subunit H